ncbi:transposase [Levilactobacillus brevis]|uniref:IS66 family transposase n=1 Tax=Levilactobacillus brevis TaxID=1580 RepID=UPI0035C6C7D7|nr:transposase [Levilactobacillus brevis]
MKKSPLKLLRNVINNALNLKDRVYQIFEHCYLPLHNNHDEQQINSTTLVRKNKSVHKTNGRRKG